MGSATLVNRLDSRKRRLRGYIWAGAYTLQDGAMAGVRLKNRGY